MIVALSLVCGLLFALLTGAYLVNEDKSAKIKALEGSYQSTLKAWIEIQEKIAHMPVEGRSLSDLGVIFHQRAVLAGFWPRPEDPPSTDWVGCQLALIHSELSEALEALRDGKLHTYFKDGKPEGAETELADALIRILDLGEGLGLDLQHAVATKHAYNLTRPYKHGRSF